MVQFDFAPDIKKDIQKIVKKLQFDYVFPARITCFRSFGSSSRAFARIWSMLHIWQKALKIKPHYCIEVLSEKFDKLNEKQKTKVLIHELLHIPKNFSGALLGHRSRGRRIDMRIINKLFAKMEES